MMIDDRSMNMKVTPLARRIAAEREIDYSATRGSGFAGRIFVRDLDSIDINPLTITEGATALAAVEPEIIEPAIAEPEIQETIQEAKKVESLRPPVFLFAREETKDEEPEIIAPEDEEQEVTEAVAEEPKETQTFDEEPEETLPIAEDPILVQDVDEEPEVIESEGEEPIVSKPAIIEETEEPPEEAPDIPEDTFSAGAMIAAAVSADIDVAGVMRMNGLRRSVAEQTAASAVQTAAVTQMMETDITVLSTKLNHINTAREKQNQIPIVAFYIKALALCVREKERFRMRLSKSKNAYFVMGGAHIGLQIGIGDGIVTPVIRDADVKSLEEIAAEVISLSDRARRGGILGGECKGGAITLIDKGESGVFAFTPIIKQPEAAIIGIGATYQRLLKTERGIENKIFIMQSLTFDHRVIAGHEADDFQLRLKYVLENLGPLFG